MNNLIRHGRRRITANDVQQRYSKGCAVGPAGYRRGVTEPARAGDLARLSETALAEAGEYIALASLARQAQNAGTAMSALSQCDTYPDAFAWVWALTREQEGRWSQVQLPSGTSVPERLTEQVEDWILTAPEPRGRGGYP